MDPSVDGRTGGRWVPVDALAFAKDPMGLWLLGPSSREAFLVERLGVWNGSEREFLLDVAAAAQDEFDPRGRRA